MTMPLADLEALILSCLPPEGTGDRLTRMLQLRDRLTREIAEERRRLAITDEQTLLEAAAQVYGVAPEEVLDSPTRQGVEGRPRGSSRVTKARHLTCWMMRRHGISTTRAGRFLGVDHTTVMYGERRVEADIAMRAIGRTLLAQIRDAAREVS